MKVVFLEDVSGVAEGGDVKEVKNGFARNFLIPKRLAVPVTREALQRVKRLTKTADETRLKVLTDMRALALELDGVRVDVEMKAGASGRLYGSVTNAIVAAHLSELTDREIDRRAVEVSEPIRQVGLFDLQIRLHPEVEASIKVLVYPVGSEPGEMLATIEAAAAGEQAEGEAVADAQAAEAAFDVMPEPRPSDTSPAEAVAESDPKTPDADQTPQAPAPADEDAPVEGEQG